MVYREKRLFIKSGLIHQIFSQVIIGESPYAWPQIVILGYQQAIVIYFIGFYAAWKPEKQKIWSLALPFLFAMGQSIGPCKFVLV